MNVSRVPGWDKGYRLAQGTGASSGLTDSFLQLLFSRPCFKEDTHLGACFFFLFFFFLVFFLCVHIE